MNYNKYKDYSLCYIEHEDYLNYYELFFTDNMKETWGDDWNDRPAISNAGEPYRDLVHIISIIIKTPYSPQFIFGGNTYSVEELNKKVAPWLTLEDDHITGGDTLDHTLSVISKYNTNKVDKIRIYLEEDFNANN